MRTLDRLEKLDRNLAKFDKWIGPADAVPIRASHQILENIRMQMPIWADPLFEDYRFKCLWGGRSCISADTKIETPTGLVPVGEFNGGAVYSFDGDRVVIGYANRPTRFDPEPLYKVTFDNGLELVGTRRHKVLSSRGQWLEIGQLRVGERVAVSSFHLESYDRQRLRCVSDPKALTIKSIEYESTSCFYDFHVPVFNNYLTEGGVINHNSGKSYAVADAFLVRGAERRRKVLCAREFQVSIRDSVHSLLKERIAEHGLSHLYDVQRDRIYGTNGTEFIFKGMWQNIDNIKSIPGITDVWVEEGQSISSNSWNVLTPTIRNEGSEIFVTFNPKFESDIVYQQFIVNPRPNAYIARVNWSENPYFSSVSEDDRQYMLQTDPEAYQHIWEGGLWKKSDAQVLNGKWYIAEFEPGEHWGAPHYGSDFGFAQDPTAAVKCWTHADCLWIEYESYQRQLEIDHTAERWRRDIPGLTGGRYTMYCDAARPETISYLRRHGLTARAADKWAGSVEDGIGYLRSFRKIIIHPRCKHAAEEALLWSYKEDPKTEEVLPKLKPGMDHVIDSIRYALAKQIKAKNSDWIKNV